MNNIIINPIQKELSAEYKKNCKTISFILQNQKYYYQEHKMKLKFLSSRNKEIKKQIKISQRFFNSEEICKVANKFKFLQKKALKKYKKEFTTHVVYDEFNKINIYSGTFGECQAYINKQDCKDYLTILP